MPVDYHFKMFVNAKSKRIATTMNDFLNIPKAWDVVMVSVYRMGKQYKVGLFYGVKNKLWLDKDKLRAFYLAKEKERLKEMVKVK